MFYVFLDTNILHQEGLESVSMQVLARLSSAEKIALFIPELVKLEFLSKRKLDTKDELDQVRKTLEGFKRRNIFFEEGANKLNELEELTKELSDEVNDQISDGFNNWCNKSKVRVIPQTESHVELVFNDYFSGDGVFKKPKNRNDFPDAFIFHEIKTIAEIDDDPLFVVIKDGGFKNALDKIENVYTFESLKELFTVEEINDSILELDAVSARIQSIKTYLESGKSNDELSAYIYSEYSYIDDTYLYDEQVDDLLGYLDLEIWGQQIEINGKENIYDLQFRNVNVINEENYVINFSFKLSVYVTYVTNYGDYLNLPEDRKESISMENMNGEGVCELKERVVCEFYGILDLHTFEKMDPKELSVHLKYLATGESEVGTYIEINKALIIGLGEQI